MPGELSDWIVLGAIGVGLLVAAGVVAPSIPLYVRARCAGVRVEMLELVGMRLRRVNARRVVAARIRAAKAGLAITTLSLETHALCGGDVERVVAAIAEARARGMDLEWIEAAAYDLAGRDMLAAVRAGVRPRVGIEDGIPRLPRS